MRYLVFFYIIRLIYERWIFIRHFTERGTEVSTYDYAHYNETILHNKSYILCFSETAQKRMGLPSVRISYNKFKSRFTIIELNDIADMQHIIKEYNLAFFYTQTHGGPDIYRFDDKTLWGSCKTIKHCVFTTSCKEGDICISISNHLIAKYNTHLPVIPLIVHLPHTEVTLRDQLRIPNDATVFGRIGGFSAFDIPMAHQAIQEYVTKNPKCYFLFINTYKFCENPRIIYLDANLDPVYKVKFINTCDAMIHARQRGESFGLSVAEFLSLDKPVLAWEDGYDLNHLEMLKDSYTLYNEDNFIGKLMNVKALSNRSWSQRTELYKPGAVMNKFKDVFLC